jgi:hypothetical protein
MLQNAVTIFAAASSLFRRSLAATSNPLRSSLLSLASTVARTDNDDNTSMTPSIRVIPSDKLYVSEPDPSWFGNGPNPSNDAAWTNGNCKYIPTNPLATLPSWYLTLLPT